MDFVQLQLQAANLLPNGGFENGGGPQGWNLTQSITGMPGTPISAAELVDSADIGVQASAGRRWVGAVS